MIVKVYKGAEGLTDETASCLGEFLAKKFGEKPVTQEDVVTAATPEKSPIHDLFEWDNAKAAHKYRLTQAAFYLRHIQVVLLNGEERGPTRAYHNVVVTQEDGAKLRAYVPARVVWERSDLAQQVREEAIRDLVAVQRRIAEYSELSVYAERIGEIVTELAG